MTEQEKIRALQRYRLLERRVEQETEGLVRLRSLAQRMTPQEEQSAQGSCTELAIERILEAEERIEADVRRMLGERVRLARRIETLPQPRQQEVLRLRYVLGKTFERIAEELDLSYQWTCELHARAVRALWAEPEGGQTTAQAEGGEERPGTGKQTATNAG